MKEYEYSFKTESLDSYIQYCIDNNYKFVQENKETRTIYRNSNKTIARITKKEIDNSVKKFLDFKEDILTNDVLIERRESLQIEFEDEDAVNSILDFLNYKKDNTLVRKRINYELNDVKFELDSYEEPEKTFVVAIEGEKDNIDKIYLEIKDL